MADIPTAHEHFEIEAFVKEGLIQNWLKDWFKEWEEDNRRQTDETFSAMYYMVVCAGTVARLWSPPDPTAKLEEAKRLILEKKGPRDAAVQWFRGIAADAELLEQIEGVASLTAHTLAQRLEVIEKGLTEEWDEAHGGALAWLHQRDYLESIMFLLNSVGQGEELRAALQALDRNAKPYHSMWALVKGLNKDARLLDVCWQEPENWWGELTILPKAKGT